jgi:HPt (histidine-containing phosphotransfer) domain-containing protein
MIPDIDPQRLHQLGAPEDPGVVAILQRFVDTLRSRVAETVAASDSPEALARQLHQLAGSSANCGFAALADFCRRVEVDPDSFEAAALAALAERATAAWIQLLADPPTRP